MNAELQNLRDALTNILHQLADDQDQHARSALPEGDIRREVAHRGAAIGLRMAAAVVSEQLTRELVGNHGRSFSGECGPLVAAALVSLHAAPS